MADFPTTQQRWLAGELSERLGHVFETMMGERIPVTATPGAGSPPDAAYGLFWRHDYGKGGVLWLAASEESWKAIGAQLLSAAGLDDAGEESIRSTYLETASQACSGAGQGLGAKLKRDCSGGSGGTAEWDGTAMEWMELTVTFGSGTAVILAGPSAALLTELAEADAAAGRSSPPPASAAQVPASSAPRTMDLLLDVELPVAVSFGRAQLPLKDVIKLTTGSIVELNRAITEPVEIIVNNCVIARGDVVVIEGNFGVRIQHIISRQERLRTLR